MAMLWRYCGGSSARREVSLHAVVMRISLSDWLALVGKKPRV